MSEAIRIDDRRVWTPADLDELYAGDGRNDVDWRRFEIVDGALVVSPPAVPRHELVVAEMIGALHPAVPAGFHVIAAAGIVMSRSFHVTDVTVLSRRAFDSNSGLVDPANVLVAVEIESPSSVTMDRVTKPAQYAAAGVPHYWRVETDPLHLHVYDLHEGVYVEAGSWSSGDRAVVCSPFPFELDIAMLLPLPG